MAKHTISNAYYSTIIFTTGYGTDNNISIPIRTIYVTKYYYTFTVESNFNLATAHTHTHYSTYVTTGRAGVARPPTWPSGPQKQNKSNTTRNCFSSHTGKAISSR